MHITDDQLHALSESERFLRKMTTWALPPDVRSELELLLAAYASPSHQPDLTLPAATEPAAPVVNLAMSRASVQKGGDQPFPGNLRQRLPEWVAARDDKYPPTPFDIDQAVERIKVVGCKTSDQ